MDGLVLMTKKDGSAAATLELNPTHGRITFGRGADCDVRIQRVTVSALHCEMLHDGHRWCLRHLSEMNNTVSSTHEASRSASTVCIICACLVHVARKRLRPL